MAKKNGSKKSNGRGGREERGKMPHIDVHPDVKNVILGIFSFVTASLFVLSYIGNG